MLNVAQQIISDRSKAEVENRKAICEILYMMENQCCLELLLAIYCQDPK